MKILYLIISNFFYHLISDFSKEDRVRLITDRFIKGEITQKQFSSILEAIEPKELKPRTEFTGYA